MLENVMIWLCGIIVGYIVSRIFTAGTLKIDRTDQQKDIYRLEVNDLDKLSKHKRIVLKVDTHANLTQK